MLQMNVVADKIAKLDCGLMQILVAYTKSEIHKNWRCVGTTHTQIRNHNNNLLNLIYTKSMPFSQHPHRHKHLLVAIATPESQSDQDLYCRSALTITTLYHHLRSQVQLYCFVASCDLLADSLGT